MTKMVKEIDEGEVSPKLVGPSTRSRRRLRDNIKG